MTVILSILLYLSVIVSPGEYHYQEIQQFEIQFEPEITAITRDAQLTNDIVEVYGPKTEYVFIQDYEYED